MSLISRRGWLKSAAVGFGGVTLCGWLPAFAVRVADDPDAGGTLSCCGWEAGRARPIPST